MSAASRSPARVLLLAALAVAVGRPPCCAEESAWRAEVREERDLPSLRGRARRIDVSGATADGATHVSITAVRLDPARVRFAVAPVMDDRAPDLAAIAERLGAIAVINGGFHDPEGRVLGRLVADGVELSPSSNARVLSGQLTVDAAGRPSLLPRDADGSGARHALQAGPFLIDPGGAMGIRSRSAPARRSAIAVADDGALLLVRSGPCVLRDLAEILHALPDAFMVRRVERALNLDGGPSAGMLVRTMDGKTWLEPPQARIRSCVLVLPPEEKADAR